MENYKIFRTIIVIFVATVVGLSVSLGAIIPAFLAILIGVMLSYVYKKNTKEVLYDERMVKISEKSSRIAMTIFAISITFIGLFLITLKDLYPEFTRAGFTLAFSAIGILGLYYVFYGYYNRKY